VITTYIVERRVGESLMQKRTTKTLAQAQAIKAVMHMTYDEVWQGETKMTVELFKVTKRKIDY